MGSLSVQYDTVSVVSFVCVALLTTMYDDGFLSTARSSSIICDASAVRVGVPRAPTHAVRRATWFSHFPHTRGGGARGESLHRARYYCYCYGTVRYGGTRIRDRHLCALPPIPPLSRPRGASMMRRERALAVGDGTSPQIIPSLISSTTQRNARTGTPPVSRGSLAVDR